MILQNIRALFQVRMRVNNPNVLHFACKMGHSRIIGPSCTIIKSWSTCQAQGECSHARAHVHAYALAHMHVHVHVAGVHSPCTSPQGVKW